jgi:hypothetical protein
MSKTFTVSVDKALIVAADFKTFTFSLVATDDNIDPISVLFSFSLQIKEPEPVKEDAQVKDQSGKPVKKKPEKTPIVPKIEIPK